MERLAGAGAARGRAENGSRKGPDSVSARAGSGGKRGTDDSRQSRTARSERRAGRTGGGSDGQMIVCIGDVRLDVLLLPQLKEAEQRAGMALRGGGSAANTAVWCAQLGAECA